MAGADVSTAPLGLYQASQHPCLDSTAEYYHVVQLHNQRRQDGMVLGGTVSG